MSSIEILVLYETTLQFHGLSGWSSIYLIVKFGFDEIVRQFQGFSGCCICFYHCVCHFIEFIIIIIIIINFISIL
jgi:hypothetical protein